MMDLNTAVDAAYQEADETESTARQVEARIIHTSASA
jgi:hypothetical protein